MGKQHQKPLQRKAVVKACLLTLGAAVIPAANAELTLNFQPVAAANRLSVDLACMPGAAYSVSSCVRGDPNSLFGKDPDTTPFYMERTTEPGFSGGYHVLIGDPNSDFSQEYYISFAGTTQWPNAFQKTASMGTYNGGVDAKPKNNFNGVFVDPLSSSDLSGSATGNPQRVTFRQTLNGTGFSQEVLKSTRANKPKITQTVADGEMSSNFVIDMSGLVYSGASALTTAGLMTNTLVVTDSQTGQVLTNFDIKTSSQNSNITGGKFAYARGPGLDGSYGNYTYATGKFDVYSVNWAAYWDPTANIPNY